MLPETSLERIFALRRAIDCCQGIGSPPGKVSIGSGDLTVMGMFLKEPQVLRASSATPLLSSESHSKGSFGNAAHSGLYSLRDIEGDSDLMWDSFLSAGICFITIG